jgi:drug/metabolite transporter (DMT)-like permease
MYLVTATVIGVAAFGEPLSLTQVAGIGLVMIALALINRG